MYCFPAGYGSNVMELVVCPLAGTAAKSWAALEQLLGSPLRGAVTQT